MFWTSVHSVHTHSTLSRCYNIAYFVTVQICNCKRQSVYFLCAIMFDTGGTYFSIQHSDFCVIIAKYGGLRHFSKKWYARRWCLFKSAPRLRCIQLYLRSRTGNFILHRNGSDEYGSVQSGNKYWYSKMLVAHGA